MDMPTLEERSNSSYRSAVNGAGTTMPSVAVIVLNWNGRDDTIACVESLTAVDYPNFSIILVDNGSTDGSVEALRRRFPGQEIVETGSNLGFAEGNNVGMRIALERGANYVFLLNNDTVVHPSLLRELVVTAERCPEGAIFGAKIYFHAEPTRIWYAGSAWDETQMRFRHLTDDLQSTIDERGVAATEHVCGCAFLVRGAILRQIGLFNPAFFLTYEETDMCYRARKAGFACYYVPGAMLWHKISASFGGNDSPLVEYFMTRNRLFFGERHMDFRRLMRLYRSVWRELGSRFIPTAIPPGRLLYRIRKLARDIVQRCQNPGNQAFVWGLLHYSFRRFGNCPDHIRMLGRKNPRSNS